MSYGDKSLPFPRASTYFQGGAVDTNKDLTTVIGCVREVPDTVHGTGTKVKLRAVKNASGSAITIARKFYKFDTGALDLGREIKGLNNVAGGLCKPMDDAYTVGNTIAAGDVFWVVESGYCYGVTEASSVNLAAGDAIASDASGLVNGAKAAAGEYSPATITVASTTKAETVVLLVNDGLVNAEAAG